MIPEPTFLFHPADLRPSSAQSSTSTTRGLQSSRPKLDVHVSFLLLEDIVPFCSRVGKAYTTNALRAAFFLDMTL